MPPLWVVRDMLSHLRLLRRTKDRLLPTTRGRDFLARPHTFFDLIATDYLYAYIHDGQTQHDVHERMHWWHVFLNLINIKARKGCSLNDLVNELYPSESYPAAQAEMTVEAWTFKSEFRYDIIRPLCWLGLLREDREGTEHSAGRHLPQNTAVGRLSKAGIRYTKRNHSPLNCAGQTLLSLCFTLPGKRSLRRAMTAGSFMKSVRLPGLRPRVCSRSSRCWSSPWAPACILLALDIGQHSPSRLFSVIAACVTRWSLSNTRVGQGMRPSSAHPAGHPHRHRSRHSGRPVRASLRSPPA